MSEDSLNIVDRLGQEFLIRRKHGENLSIDDFVAEHPGETGLRGFLEACLVMDELNAEEMPPAKKSVVNFPQIEDFHIIREIGRGGMGIVFEAEQLSLSRRVAIKTISSGGSSSEIQWKRFQLEARTAAQLQHPNIVPVYEVGESDGSIYLVMQLISGRPLDKVMRALIRMSTSGTLSKADEESISLANLLLSGDENRSASSVRKGLAGSSSHFSSTNALRSAPSSAQFSTLATGSHRQLCRSIVRIGSQVAGALAFAHENGVIHRDIKPANLLLDASGNAWVADFGLVKTAGSELTQTGDFVGTLRYMPPERFAGVCDARSDVYALGATLYEMLAGQPAFSSPDQFSLLEQIRETEPMRLRQVDRRIPRDVETIVAKSMEKEPTRRYSQASELQDDLERFLSGKPIVARQTSPLEKTLIWSRHHPMVSLLITSLVLGVILTSIGSSIAAVRFRAQRTEQTKLANTNRNLANDNLVKSQEAIRQRDAAQLNAYFADMRSANQDWQEGQVFRMLTTLRKYIPAAGEQDLRGWEWRFLLSLANQEDNTTVDEEVTFQLEWTADGQRLVCATRNGTLHVRDSNCDSERRIDIPGLQQFSLSPAGDHVVTIGSESVAIWDLKTGKLTREIATDPRAAGAVDWDSTGDRICYSASLEGSGLTILSLSTGESVSVSAPSGYPMRSMKFSPDGKYLAVCSGIDRAQILDIRNHRWVNRNPPFSFETLSVDWHPNSQRFAEGTTDEGVIIFEISDSDESGKHAAIRNQPVAQLANRRWVEDVAFSPTGNNLAASGRAHRVDIFDLNSGKIKRSLRGHLGTSLSAAWHPSQSRIATSSIDGTIKLWHLGSRDKLAHTFARIKARTASGISRDGKWKWKRQRTPSQAIIVFDPKTDKELGRANLRDSDWLYTPIFFSESDRMLIAESYVHFPDGDALERNSLGETIGWSYLWRTDTWEQIEVIDSGGWRPNFAVHQDLLVVADDADGFVRAFDFSKNEDVRFRAHLDTINLVLSPDGTRLATCCGPKVTIWDTTTWSEIESYFGHAPNSYVYSVRWDSRGRYLVTGSSDGTAKVWDTRTHALVHTLIGHQAVVKVLGISSDDSRLITRSDKVHVWHIPTGREIFAYPVINENTDTNEFQIANERILKLADAAAPFRALSRAERVAQSQSSPDGSGHQRTHALAKRILNPSKKGYAPHRALNIAKEAVRSAPHNREYLSTLAWAKYRTGDVSGALITIRSVVQNTDVRPESLLLLTLCEKQSGNNAAATQAYAKANLLLNEKSFNDELRSVCFEVVRHMLRTQDQNSQIVVTTLADEIDGVEDGSVSLREAIAISRPGSQVSFSVEGEIELWMGPITIGHSVEIIGPGATKLTLSGLEKSRIFEIDDGDSTHVSTVEIAGLRFTKGAAAKQWTGQRGPSLKLEELGGGAILAKENLTITDSVFDKNGNSATWGGGAICAGFGARVKISKTTFSNNVADEDGAVWLENPANAIIENCTFDSNRANWNSALDGCGVIEIHNTTFSNNESSVAGTLRYRGTDVLVNHCTFFGNKTSDGIIALEFDGRGNSDPTERRLQFTNCIFSGNHSESGKVFHFQSRELGTIVPVLVSNTIMDVESLTSNVLDKGNNHFGVDALLGPLANNGGLTMTHALLDGSPAIDAGVKSGLEFDQRGAPFERSRSVGANQLPDIGAFEVQ